MKRDDLTRKPIGIFWSVLGLLLLLGAAIPLHAQYHLYNDPRYLLGFNDFNGRPMQQGSEWEGPGEDLVRKAKADLYVYNFKAAIPLLEKGVLLANPSAMHYLSICYCYGYGVPINFAQSNQLRGNGYKIANERILRIERKQQEGRERVAAAFLMALAASSSTHQSAPKPKELPGPVVATPWGLGWRGPFGTVLVPRYSP